MQIVAPSQLMQRRKQGKLRCEQIGLAVLRRLPGHDDARHGRQQQFQITAQFALAVLARAQAKFTSHGLIEKLAIGSWRQLARIAANKAKDYLRSAWVRKMNTPGDEVLALEGAPPGMQPEQQVLEALGEEELTGMILNLREPYCTPCRLVLLAQHTMAEAARLCGRPPKTVEAQVYRAKKMLAQQILQNDRIPCERRSVHGTV